MPMLEGLPYQRVLLDSLVVAVIIAITSLFTRTLRTKRAGERLPPGPPGHWFFGHTSPRSQYVKIHPTRLFAHYIVVQPTITAS